MLDELAAHDDRVEHLLMMVQYELVSQCCDELMMTMCDRGVEVVVGAAIGIENYVESDV